MIVKQKIDYSITTNHKIVCKDEAIIKECYVGNTAEFRKKSQVRFYQFK